MSNFAQSLDHHLFKPLSVYVVWLYGCMVVWYGCMVWLYGERSCTISFVWLRYVFKGEINAGVFPLVLHLNVRRLGVCSFCWLVDFSVVLLLQLASWWFRLPQRRFFVFVLLGFVRLLVLFVCLFVFFFFFFFLHFKCTTSSVMLENKYFQHS